MSKVIYCDSRGDKRFSALYAILNSYQGHTIEYLYQVAIKGYNSIKEGKGRKGKLMSYAAQRTKYRYLWWLYLEENPTLKNYLRGKRKEGYIFVDRFAKQGVINQGDTLMSLTVKHRYRYYCNNVEYYIWAYPKPKKHIARALERRLSEKGKKGKLLTQFIQLYDPKEEK